LNIDRLLPPVHLFHIACYAIGLGSHVCPVVLMIV